MEPLRRPLVEVATGRGRQRREEIGGGRVAPGMGAEIVVDALRELIGPDPCHELLQDRGALLVGDPVERRPHRVEVGHVADDRVGGRHLVLRGRADLEQAGERRPHVFEASAVGDRERADVGRERLVEPQVVPPAHGHEIAEPHVGHLVHDHERAHLPVGLGRGRPEDEARVVERDGSGVFHRAGELGHEHLVIFRERIRVAESLDEEVEAALRDVEELVVVEVLDERLPAPDRQRDDLRTAVWRRDPVLVANEVVRAGDDDGQVGREDRGAGETPAGRLSSVPSVATPAGVDDGVGMLDTTSHRAGAMTSSCHVALMSGCSKHA